MPGSEGELWRLFVALPVSEEVKEKIRPLQQELRSRLGLQGVRLTRPESTHLTLVFIGNVESGKVPDLGQALREQCAGTEVLRLSAEGVGFFPNPRTPRVVWVAVGGGVEDLRALQSRVSAATASFMGSRDDKDFAAHLTLGRFNRLRGGESRWLGEFAAQHAGDYFGNWVVDTVELMRSELSAGGSRYTCLERIPLGGG